MIGQQEWKSESWPKTADDEKILLFIDGLSFVVQWTMDNVHTNDMLNGMLNTSLAMPVALDFTLVSKVSEWVGFKLA